MPDLAVFHPQVVHFAIALLLLGVAFRITSLTPWLKFTNHAATTLLILGTIAAAVAVRSGDDAHGPVERIPGVRNAVIEHEEYGERARNIFFVVMAFELLALGLARTTAGARFGRSALVGSAIVGVGGSMMLYEAAEHGGELVYAYAGGPGVRSGDPGDVTRLLIAGLYQQSVADRRAGRAEDAARLVDEMAARMPEDTTAQLLRVESLLIDRADAATALVAARAVMVDPANPRLATRHATLTADAFLALGQPDSARAVLAPVVAAFPQNTRLKAKLDSIP
jgi:uncharacterized membrane protein